MKNILFICFLTISCSLAKAQVIKDSIIVKKHAPSQFMKVLDECQRELKYNKAETFQDPDYSADYEIRFFKQSRHSKALYKADAFRSCNFYIGPQRKTELGITEFIYKNKVLADKAFKYLELKGNYAFSKIAMDFTCFQIGNSVFIVLSERWDGSIKDLIEHLSVKYHGT